MKVLSIELLFKYLGATAEVSDVLFMPNVAIASIDTDLILSNAQIIQLNNNRIEDKGLVQLWFVFPLAWWFDLSNNSIKRLIHTPCMPLALSSLKITGNLDITGINSMHIMRVSIHDNNQFADFQSKKNAIEQLPNVWVINDDYIANRERFHYLSKSSSITTNETVVLQSWSTRKMSNRETILITAINNIPTNEKLSDYYKLDILLEDYLEESVYYNSFVHSRVTSNDSHYKYFTFMPFINMHRILHLPHSLRLDLSVLLTASILFQLPAKLTEDAFVIHCNGMLSIEEVKQFLLLPIFVRTAIISIIRRICNREKFEMEVIQSLVRKPLSNDYDIDNFIKSSDAFKFQIPTYVDGYKGFKFLRSVKQYLESPIIRSNNDGGMVPLPFSELELEILMKLPDVPVRSMISNDFHNMKIKRNGVGESIQHPSGVGDWQSLTARHTMIILMKSPMCPSLTKSQQSKINQERYNELLSLLQAAAMTLSDLDLRFVGPGRDGRVLPHPKASRSNANESNIHVATSIHLINSQLSPARISGKSLKLMLDEEGDELDMDSTRHSSAPMNEAVSSSHDHPLPVIRQLSPPAHSHRSSFNFTSFSNMENKSNKTSNQLIREGNRSLLSSGVVIPFGMGLPHGSVNELSWNRPTKQPPDPRMVEVIQSQMSQMAPQDLSNVIAMTDSDDVRSVHTLRTMSSEQSFIASQCLAITETSPIIPNPLDEMISTEQSRHILGIPTIGNQSAPGGHGEVQPLKSLMEKELLVVLRNRQQLRELHNQPSHTSLTIYPSTASEGLTLSHHQMTDPPEVHIHTTQPFHETKLPSLNNSILMFPVVGKEEGRLDPLVGSNSDEQVVSLNARDEPNTEAAALQEIQAGDGLNNSDPLLEMGDHIQESEFKSSKRHVRSNQLPTNHLNGMQQQHYQSKVPLNLNPIVGFSADSNWNPSFLIAPPKMIIQHNIDHGLVDQRQRWDNLEFAPVLVSASSISALTNRAPISEVNQTQGGPIQSIDSSKWNESAAESPVHETHPVPRNTRTVSVHINPLPHNFTLESAVSNKFTVTDLSSGTNLSSPSVVSLPNESGRVIFDDEEVDLTIHNNNDAQAGEVHLNESNTEEKLDSNLSPAVEPNVSIAEVPDDRFMSNPSTPFPLPTEVQTHPTGKDSVMGPQLSGNKSVSKESSSKVVTVHDQEYILALQLMKEMGSLKNIQNLQKLNRQDAKMAMRCHSTVSKDRSNGRIDQILSQDTAALLSSMYKASKREKVVRVRNPPSIMTGGEVEEGSVFLTESAGGEVMMDSQIDEGEEGEEGTGNGGGSGVRAEESFDNVIAREAYERYQVDELMATESLEKTPFGGLLNQSEIELDYLVDGSLSSIEVLRLKNNYDKLFSMADVTEFGEYSTTGKVLKPTWYPCLSKSIYRIDANTSKDIPMMKPPPSDGDEDGGLQSHLKPVKTVLVPKVFKDRIPSNVDTSYTKSNKKVDPMSSRIDTKSSLRKSQSLKNINPIMTRFEPKSAMPLHPVLSIKSSKRLKQISSGNDKNISTETIRNEYGKTPVAIEEIIFRRGGNQPRSLNHQVTSVRGMYNDSVSGTEDLVLTHQSSYYENDSLDHQSNSTAKRLLQGATDPMSLRNATITASSHATLPSPHTSFLHTTEPMEDSPVHEEINADTLSIASPSSQASFGSVATPSHMARTLRLNMSSTSSLAMAPPTPTALVHKNSSTTLHSGSQDHLLPMNTTILGSPKKYDGTTTNPSKSSPKSKKPIPPRTHSAEGRTFDDNIDLQSPMIPVTNHSIDFSEASLFSTTPSQSLKILKMPQIRLENELNGQEAEQILKIYTHSSMMNPEQSQYRKPVVRIGSPHTESIRKSFTLSDEKTFQRTGLNTMMDHPHGFDSTMVPLGINTQEVFPVVLPYVSIDQSWRSNPSSRPGSKNRHLHNSSSSYPNRSSESFLESDHRHHHHHHQQQQQTTYSQCIQPGLPIRRGGTPKRMEIISTMRDSTQSLDSNYYVKANKELQFLGQNGKSPWVGRKNYAAATTKVRINPSFKQTVPKRPVHSNLDEWC